MARDVSVYRFALVNTGDVRLPALCPPPVLDPAFLASVAELGVLVPLLVRPAVRTLVVQEGRRGGVFGYFLIDARRGQGSHYRGLPTFFPVAGAPVGPAYKAACRAARMAAEAALPPDVPYEVIEGRRRLAAAKAARLRQVPCVIGGLDDAEVDELAEV